MRTKAAATATMSSTTASFSNNVGRGSLRTEVHGPVRRGQAGKLRPDDRWGMRSRSSSGARKEQEVHPELRRCVHPFDSSLQKARGVCCVLGSSKLCAPEWSQGRDAVGVAQAVEGAVQ